MIAEEDKLPLFEAAILVASQAPYVAESCRRGNYRGKYTNPLFGLCYTLSEALYHLCEEPLEPMWIRFGAERGMTHWYLRRASTHEVIDLTASQFPAKDFFCMYEAGRRRAFGTREPSRRAQMVLSGIDRERSHFRKIHLGEANFLRQQVYMDGAELQAAIKRKAENSNPTP